MGIVIRVVIVDDDALVREGLKLILGGADNVEVAGVAGDGREAIAVVSEVDPDVILMDMHMPGMDGLAATQQLRASHPSCRVIALTTFHADSYVLSALAAGAAGFLLKDTKPAQIISAIESVAAGEPVLSPKVTARLIARLVAEQSSAVAPVADRGGEGRRALTVLSDREREVAFAIARGMSNAEIGASLYMSVATIKAHVGRILNKLGLENRTQIAILVHESGKQS